MVILRHACALDNTLGSSWTEGVKMTLKLMLLCKHDRTKVYLTVFINNNNLHPFHSQRRVRFCAVLRINKVLTR